MITKRIVVAFLATVLPILACAVPIGNGVGTHTPIASATPSVAPGASPTVAQIPTVEVNEPDPDTPAPLVNEVLIYMIALEDNGASGPAVGCGDSLIPVRRSISPTNEPLKAALNELLSQKDQFYGESGLFNALYQSDLVVISAEIDASGVATMALAGQPQLGGTCDTPRFQAQIEQTALGVPGVTAVNVFLNGQPIEDALSQR